MVKGSEGEFGSRGRRAEEKTRRGERQGNARTTRTENSGRLLRLLARREHLRNRILVLLAAKLHAHGHRKVEGADLGDILQSTDTNAS